LNPDWSPDRFQIWSIKPVIQWGNFTQQNYYPLYYQNYDQSSH